MTQILSKKTLSLYGFLALPVAFAGFPLYMLAPDFYAVEYGISLTSLGSILLILRLIDGVQDPIIGSFSDRYRTYMKYMIFLLGGILSISFFAVFHPMTAPLLWFSISMFIAMTCFSFLSILLNSLGSLWSSDSQHQTSISFAREIFGLVGLLIAVSLPSILSQIMSIEEAYSILWGILTICLLIGCYCFYNWLKHHIHFKNNTSSKKSNLLQTFKNAPKKFLFIYGVNTLSSSMPGVLVIFFVRDLLNSEEYFGPFLFIFFLSGALFMGMWKNLAQKYDKYYIWFISMILSVITFSGAFLLGAGDGIYFVFICAASGMVSGANLMIPPAILGDYIHKNDYIENVSSHYAFLTFIAKSTLGIASITVLPMIEYFGFIGGQDNSEIALFSLSLGYALIPSILKAMSAFLLWFYFIRSSHRSLL